MYVYFDKDWLSDIVDRRFGGVVFGLHDVGHHCELAVLCLHILL